MSEEIRRPDGSVLTPINRSSELDKKDFTDITDSLNKNTLYNGTIGFSFKAPVQPPVQPPSKLDDTNDLLREQNDEIQWFRRQLEDSTAQLKENHTQLKQLNDKTSSQTLRIVKLETDLKTEREKNAIIEEKLSKKNLQIGIASILLTTITLIADHHQEIYNFIISLMK